MTRRRALFSFAVFATCAIAALALTRTPPPAPKPEPPCDSCTARHKDMQKLRLILKSKNIAPEPGQ